VKEKELKDVISTFSEQAIEDLAAVEAGLMLLEVGPEDRAVGRELLLHLEAIEQYAREAGFTALEAFAQSYAAMVVRICDASEPVDRAVLLSLASAIRTFRRVVVGSVINSNFPQQ